MSKWEEGVFVAIVERNRLDMSGVLALCLLAFLSIPLSAAGGRIANVLPKKSKERKQ